MRPCPHCGRFQPGMFVHRRCLFHLIVAVVAAGTFAICAVGAGKFTGYIISVERATQVSHTFAVVLMQMALIATATIAHFLIARRNPNRSPEWNQLDGANSKTLILDTVGKPSDAVLPLNFSGIVGRRPWALALMALGFIVSFSPEVLRVSLGWYANLGAYPPIVGPGESTLLYFEEPIKAVGGRWVGRTKARAANFGELGIPSPDLESHTKQDGWTNLISTKEGDSNTAYVWIEVKLPTNDRLVGSTLQLELEASIRYPQPIGGGKFIEQKREFRDTRELRVATSHAGRIYSVAWWSCIVVTAGCYLLGVWWLLMADDFLRTRGSVTTFTPDEATF